MKTRAVSMVLLMIASALAGCTSGDPDGDGGMGIDTDMLNEMIEDNLQDFINNTSVTVHQEIHYHNNTTVVNNYDETNNEYQNTTNVDGEEVVNNNYNTNHYNSSLGGGDGSGSMLHGIDFVFTLQDILGVNESTADRDNTYTTNYSYYDYFTSEFRNDMFTFNCGVYYIDVSANSSNSSNYWDDSNNFDDAWDDNGYNSTMRDLFNQVAWDSELRYTCDESYDGDENDWETVVIYTVTIPEGYAFSCRSSGQVDWLRVFDGNSSDPTDPTEWESAGYPQLYLDGIRLSKSYNCPDWNQDSGNIWIGGGESMELTFVDTIQYYHTYRLMFNYELRPVVMHSE